MKILTKIHLVSILMGLFLFSSCVPKSGPRFVHEPKREWIPSETPQDLSVEAKEFYAYDLAKAYKDLAAPESVDLLEKIVKPLSRFVLNRTYIESPEYFHRISEMLALFNKGLLILLTEKKDGDNQAEIEKIKDLYYATVFSGCSRDLREDCTNKNIFSSDSRTSKILVILATDLDEKIRQELIKMKTPRDCINGSELCRTLVEERYRRLAMATATKRNKLKDEDFSFSYLKYSRIYALLMDWWQDKSRGESSLGAEKGHGGMSLSYLNSVHGKIFEILISGYKPRSLNDPEFREFVEYFNPWTYSNRSADLFRYGTQIMFDLGARCCLYQDSDKKKLNPSVVQAIEEGQKEADGFGPSFSQIVVDIQKSAGFEIFQNLGIEKDARRILEKDPEFFNEFFFIVDRLFRDHLNHTQIQRVLGNANRSRALDKLPEIVSIYVRMYLVYMIVETNKFMNDIYNSNSVGSDQVFQEAVLKSRDISSRWLSLQSRIDVMDKFLGSYFKGQNTSSISYLETSKMLQSVNRNVHYFSVYPNMIVMTYYLAKMRGAVKAQTWWGKTIDIPADTILEELFEGRMVDLWFRFGVDAEVLSKEMILYSFQYMMSTNTLNTFVAKEDSLNGLNGSNGSNSSNGSTGSNRSKFFDLIFTKYLDEGLRELNDDVLKFERDTIGSEMFNEVKQVCQYEVDTKGRGRTPHLMINFLNLGRYTYSGAGRNGINDMLLEFLGGAFKPANSIRTVIDQRISHLLTMVDLIEADLLRSKKIGKRGDSHPDLVKVREYLVNLESLKKRFMNFFISNHRKYLDCFLTLGEIEQRRMNRIYEEERQHLGRIYDLISPLGEEKNEIEFGKRAKYINEMYFRNVENGYRFDRIDGLTYRMSKFDLLTRIKRSIENDIFMTPSEREKQIYGEDLSRLLRPRSVEVYMPVGLDREDLVSKGTSLSISYRLGMQRADFIKQGMAVFNSKGDAFVEWNAQIASGSDMKKYLETLVELYLIGGNRSKHESCSEKSEKCSDSSVVSADDLIEMYLRVLGSYTLNELDIENAQDFGIEGKMPKEFFEDWIFEKTSLARLPLFYGLMNSIYETAGIRIDNKGKGVNPNRWTGPIVEATSFARTLNNLGVFIFPPGSEVRDAVRLRYGSRAHHVLTRVQEIFDRIGELELPEKNLIDLYPRLKQSFYLEDKAPVFWWNKGGSLNLVDRQKLENLQIIKKSFVQQTDDFYQTRSVLKVK
ncbi:MAG: hypothetical protein IPJ71_05275 [Bdellovibrionales bacterium]|nr:hypothetical protein [Bdellovibrionales bacterium]